MTHARLASSTGIVLVLVAAIVVILVMIIAATAVNATECQARPDDRGYWTWRTVDERRCWYRGHHVLPKSALHWAKKPADASGNDTRKPPVQTDKLQPVGDNADYNYIDAQADDLTPLVDIDEAHPFGVWEERVSGQFAGAISK